MRPKPIAVILPALDEEGAVGGEVATLRGRGLRVIVVDNGSRDRTAARAHAAGAEVVHEPRRGYGAACIRGIEHLKADPPQVVVFSDCDGTSDPDDIAALVAPILQGDADLVLGRRTRIAQGALPWKNRVARSVAVVTFRVLFRLRIHDVPPLRAVAWSTLEELALGHRTYGLPVETVAKAARQGARIVEVPVAYRTRSAGRSKVGTNLLQAAWVGWIMLLVPLRVRFGRRTR